VSLYSNILEQALLPFYDLVRRRKYARYRAFLEQSQWWSPERLREFQWQELQRLLNHAFSTVPYYQRKYQAAGVCLGDIRTWEDFQSLPPLTRQEVNTYLQELISKSYSGPLVADSTGGSTGIPTHFFLTLDNHDWRTACTQRAYSWSGSVPGERTLYLSGAPLRPQSRWEVGKEGLYHWFRRELLVNTFRQTDDFWNDTWGRAVAFGPRFLVGYVASLESFIRYGQQQNLKLPELRAVLAMAEPVYDNLRQKVRDVLNVPLFNTYGSREFMSIAVECAVHQGLHVNAENILLETKMPPEGGPSEVLVTDLHNYGMPFIRYEIGDMALMDAKPCACGRGLPKIQSIEGRTLDVLRGADGQLVPGEFFPHLLKEINEISEFQVEQKQLDHLLLSVVLTRPLSEERTSWLNGEVTKVFGERTRLEITQVPSIARRASGKRRVTVGLAW
jgi:phenylacetate-CoA ligase